MESSVVLEKRERAAQVAKDLQSQLERVVFGQQDVIQSLLVALIAGGHVLLEGVPGLAKTLLVKSLGKVLDCRFSRIQFTPDLMPSDITGISLFDSNKTSSSFAKDPYSPTWSWPMRSTEHPPKHRLLCWRPCKSIK